MSDHPCQNNLAAASNSSIPCPLSTSLAVVSASQAYSLSLSLPVHHCSLFSSTLLPQHHTRNGAYGTTTSVNNCPRLLAFESIPGPLQGWRRDETCQNRENTSSKVTTLEDLEPLATHILDLFVSNQPPGRLFTSESSRNLHTEHIRTTFPSIGGHLRPESSPFYS